MNKKYIVTGGAGFIGSHIVDELIQKGCGVLVLDNLSTGNISNINSKAEFIELDLTHIEQSVLNNLFADASAVFHCAALPNVQFSVDNPLLANGANVDTTIKVLEAIRYNHIPKIIYSGSSSVYGNANVIPTDEQESIKPLSPYALQKYVGEEYCYLYHKMYNISYIVFRYFNVYGERMTNKGAYVSVLSHFLKSYQANEPLNIVNDGTQKRDFVYVKDIAQANILAAMDKNINNITMNLGAGRNYSINKIADWFGLDKIYSEKRIEPYETLADINLAMRTLNWNPSNNLKTWVTNNLVV